MKEAVQEVQHGVKAISKLIYLGLARFGKEVVNKEFFLRRVTNLSLNLYGILCLLAKIGAEQQHGREISDQIRLLGYFVEQAKASRKDNSSLHGGRRESLHHKIFRDIISS